MIRMLFAASLAAGLVLPAQAQMLGDFDCTSDLEGPYTPAGLLRIEEPTSFTFLDPATARPGKFFAMDMITDETVNFDDAFADHISPGAIMVEASYFADAFTYEAAILTAKGRVVLVSCPFIP
ncbi:hypothetical protein [Devosia sp.]|uniref:hypothetical protein n=1 Tax=Devosia sp. TaxID=1871048 RepID=UPI000869C020|nr:hypothetical protein [Devosia sp.]ODT78442.1 MAG: hypothetical protein ABS76_23940 [Pelagibacterium sp. SCN 64-44]